jgi:hypothetical protein
VVVEVVVAVTMEAGEEGVGVSGFVSHVNTVFGSVSRPRRYVPLPVAPFPIAVVVVIVGAVKMVVRIRRDAEYILGPA